MPNHKHRDALATSDAERHLLDKTPDATREARVQQLQDALATLSEPAAHEPKSVALVQQRSALSLELAGLYLDLDRKADAWPLARDAVVPLLAQQQFEDAALACQYVYLANQEDAIAAIGQAAWLAVTYPVDPHLTANILDHIIDETPDDSDGAAVAAATAHYVADMRGELQEQDELKLFTGSMLARVARRHSNISNQQTFELWVERLELDQPEKFLVRLRNVVDVMVQTDWWFDREALSQALPDDDTV